eukprot:TRINITY_DN17173_c2_g2_i2.p1 TRINITY_DN17173_c2_g2~~TRINITY_DN17173_c2_g2_i2.p1  ORF type:complete len:391 (+),score=64.41 TRINITY_DN17173_c2_g2_i2:169-1341(+)
MPKKERPSALPDSFFTAKLGDGPSLLEEIPVHNTFIQFDATEGETKQKTLSTAPAWIGPSMQSVMQSAVQEEVEKKLSPEELAKLPSIGSVKHDEGLCKRCCFFPKGRCNNGHDCEFCHFDHEKRKRKSKKKNKAIDLLSTSAEGGSLPVSPDRPFGPGGMLSPQADFPSPPVLGAGRDQQGAALAPAAGFHAGQTNPYFSSATPGRSNELVSELDRWFGAGPSQSDVLPSIQGASNPVDFMSDPHALPLPTGIEPSQYPPSADASRKDEYIRQLEAENRYLRSLVTQYAGPTAGSILPPPSPLAGSLSQEPASAASSTFASPSSASKGRASPFATAAKESYGMSANATPFTPWSQSQAWAQKSTISGDASTRTAGLAPLTHHGLGPVSR